MATAIFVVVPPPAKILPLEPLSLPLFHAQYLYALPQGSDLGAPDEEGTQPPFPEISLQLCGFTGSVRPSPSGSLPTASCNNIPRATRASDFACSIRLTSTIVDSGPRIVDIMPAPSTPTTATAPKSVKNTFPRSLRLFILLSHLEIIS